MTFGGVLPVHPPGMSPHDETADGLEALHQRPDDPEQGRRAELIVRAARRDVSFRDFTTFAFVRTWTAVLAIGAVFFTFFGPRRKAAR